MRLCLLVMLFSATPIVSAQVVYKCVAKDGAVSYQSNSCEAGQVAKDAWSAQPDTMTAAEIRQRERRLQQEAANSRYLRQLANRYARPAANGSARRTKQPSDTRCEAARKHRDRIDNGSRHLTYRELERLGDMVYEACK